MLIFTLTAEPPPKSPLLVYVFEDDPHGVRGSADSVTAEYFIEANHDYKRVRLHVGVPNGDPPRKVTYTVQEGSGYIVDSDNNRVEITVSDHPWDDV